MCPLKELAGISAMLCSTTIILPPRHSERPNRIQPSCLTALGRQVRFRLFPTPPHGDAVTVQRRLFFPGGRIIVVEQVTFSYTAGRLAGGWTGPMERG